MKVILNLLHLVHLELLKRKSFRFSDFPWIFRSFQEIGCGSSYMENPLRQALWYSLDPFRTPQRDDTVWSRTCVHVSSCICIYCILVTESFLQWSGNCFVLQWYKNRKVHWIWTHWIPNLTNSPLDSRPPKACQLEWSEWSEWNFARGPSALWAPEHLHIPYTKPGMKNVKDRNVTRSTSSSSIECIVYRAIIPYFMLKDSQIKYMYWGSYFHVSQVDLGSNNNAAT